MHLAPVFRIELTRDHASGEEWWSGEATLESEHYAIALDPTTEIEELVAQAAAAAGRWRFRYRALQIVWVVPGASVEAVEAALSAAGPPLPGIVIAKR